jgi:hypothetical protein
MGVRFVKRLSLASKVCAVSKSSLSAAVPRALRMLSWFPLPSTLKPDRFPSWSRYDLGYRQGEANALAGALVHPTSADWQA